MINIEKVFCKGDRITTVDISLKHLGNRAVEELMSLIEDKEAPRKNIVLETKLIERESC